VFNDAHLLGGALLTYHRPWGIAVIAGTGSVIIRLEVTPLGEVIQASRQGGLGNLLGDDGSGEWPVLA
jgi:N-acetylglucosamine kinase-like BadF-type ATPase